MYKLELQSGRCGLAPRPKRKAAGGHTVALAGLLIRKNLGVTGAWLSLVAGMVLISGALVLTTSPPRWLFWCVKA